MTLYAWPARQDGSAGDVPDVINRPVNGTESFKKGTVLQTTSGDFTEAAGGATSGLHSVAMEEAVDGEPSNPTDELTAARINRQTIFAFPVSVGGSISEDVAANVNVGDTGDLIVVGDVHAFDADSAASAAMEVEEIWDEKNVVLVKFLDSVIA